MGICMHACYVHHIHAWSWQRLEEGVVTPGAGVDGYESLCGYWEPNLGPLQELPLLLPTGLSIQPHLLKYIKFFFNADIFEVESHCIALLGLELTVWTRDWP